MHHPQLKDKFRKLLGSEWFNVLEDYLESKDFSNTTLEMFKERRKHVVYPVRGSDLLFKAFRTTPLSEVRVVILGQDPYHDGSYDGFAFSNTNRLRLSPSLQNILKEVESDVYDGFQLSQDSELERWAKQGVLLINTAHTVREKEPASHLHLWGMFTFNVIKAIIDSKHPTVWMLWGAKAKKHLENKALPEHHLRLITSHPSPFAAHQGFLGCKHFSKANDFLIKHNVKSITW